MRIKNYMAVLFLIFSLNAIAAEQSSGHDISHKEWYKREMEVDEYFLKFYMLMDREAYRCRELPCHQKIHRALDELKKNDDLQEQRGCFSFKTWTPACDEYRKKDIGLMSGALKQLELGDSQK